LSDSRSALGSSEDSSVAHEILLAVHRVLATHAAYIDPGVAMLRARNDDTRRRKAIRSLEKLGYQVILEEPHRAA
jgi:hypothetical protein